MMAGRESKLTPEMTQKLCSALRAGNTRRAACLYAGISADSFANYLRDSSDFSEAVTRAEGEAEVGYIAVIKKCALAGDWRAAAWWASHHPNAKHDWRQVSEIKWSDLSTDAILALLGAGEGDPGAESAGDRMATEGEHNEPGEHPLLPADADGEAAGVPGADV
jgi:hypothetical protein